MPSLTFKQQIMLAPVVLIIPIIFVILLTLSYLDDIGVQNDTVRDWATATDQLQIGMSSIRYLQDTSELLKDSSGAEAEELVFDYLEKSRLLSESLKHISLLDKVEPQNLAELQSMASSVRYRDNMEINQVMPVLANLYPRLEQLYRSLQAKKRAMYIDSNEYINHTTSRLATISISVLGIFVLLGITLVLWINKSTSKRLRKLALSAKTLCNQPEGVRTAKPRDELDQLASCLSLISQQQLNLLATEKLIEGGEEERRRIAMDIHDQFLSDLSGISRSLEMLENTNQMSPADREKLLTLQQELQELTVNLRGIIDDLHPSSLEILGLEAAIRSFLQRKIASLASIDYFLSIDPQIDQYLENPQRLNLYRIILEVVNNILHHAHCSRFEINLHLIDNNIILNVEDNGVGFDVKTALNKQGHGLHNIEQRVLSLNASHQWGSSRFTSGSSFKLVLPVHEQHTKKLTSAAGNVNSLNSVHA